MRSIESYLTVEACSIPASDRLIGYHWRFVFLDESLHGDTGLVSKGPRSARGIVTLIEANTD